MNRNYSWGIAEEVNAQSSMEKQSSSMVYFLYKGSNIVYIGKSKNGIVRIVDHIGVKDFDRWDGILVPPDYLDEVESELILALKPLSNIQKTVDLGKNKTFYLSEKVIQSIKETATEKNMSESKLVNEILSRVFAASLI